MNALVDFVVNNGVLGVLALVVVVGAAVGYRLIYRHWRDLIEERDFWRDVAWKSLEAGEALAGRGEGDE